MLSDTSELIEQEARHVRELKLKEQFCIPSVCTYAWLLMVVVVWGGCYLFHEFH